MSDRLIDWSSPGNYDPLWVAIGLILMGLLLADFVWIYFKQTRKDKDTARKKESNYRNKKAWEYS